MALTSVEMCAGAGGQALGIEQAGFDHQALVEIEADYCATLRHNRPHWPVVQSDLAAFDGRPYRGADLLAGGLPCPPFSKAGKQLGARDERNLFPVALRLADEIRPRAILIENVRGFLDPVFADYREELRGDLDKLGYVTQWRLLQASDFGVPQLRPRVAIVALRRDLGGRFEWPAAGSQAAPAVGDVLFDLMGANGWAGATAWREQAKTIAPTIVGGSKKHGGPDLGPRRAKAAWAGLGVDAHAIADAAPAQGFTGMPRLTLTMVTRLQGFPPDWIVTGRKTSAYRQAGNAFPPPVACALATQIRKVLAG